MISDDSDCFDQFEETICWEVFERAVLTSTDSIGANKIIIIYLILNIQILVLMILILNIQI